MKKLPVQSAPEFGETQSIMKPQLVYRLGVSLPPLTVFKTGNLLDLSRKGWAAFSKAAKGRYQHPFIKAYDNFEWMSFNHFDYQSFSGQDAANLFHFLSGIKNIKRLVFGFLFPPSVVQSDEFKAIQNMGVYLFALETSVFTNMISRLDQFENLTELYLDRVLSASLLNKRRRQYSARDDIVWEELGGAIEKCSQLQLLSMRANEIADYSPADFKGFYEMLMQAPKSILCIDLNYNQLYRLNDTDFKALIGALYYHKSLLSCGLHHAESPDLYVKHATETHMIDTLLKARQMGYNHSIRYLNWFLEYGETKSDYLILPMAFSYLMTKLYYSDNAVSAFAEEHGYKFSFVKFSEFFDQGDYASALTLAVFADYEGEGPEFEQKKEGLRLWMIDALKKENMQWLSLLGESKEYGPQHASVFWSLGMNMMALCDYREAFYAFRNAQRLSDSSTVDLNVYIQTSMKLLEERNHLVSSSTENIIKEPLRVVHYAQVDQIKESSLYRPVLVTQPVQYQPPSQTVHQGLFPPPTNPNCNPHPTPTAPPLEEDLDNPAPPSYDQVMDQYAYLPPSNYQTQGWSGN